MEPVDLTSTYLDLRPSVRRIPVGPTFWDEVMRGERDDLDGTTVSAYDYAADWSWERHPAGDEVVVQLWGATTFVLEVDGEERRVTVHAGEAVVVPAGVWHRAEIVEPGRVLHITPGAGTDHR